MFVYDQMGTGFHYHQSIVCDPVASLHDNELYKRVESLIRMKKGAEARCQNSSNFQLGTLPETNIAPESGWLEYSFPFGMAYCQVLY